MKLFGELRNSIGMTRRPRTVIPGWVHHVTQRGNYKQSIFYSNHDRIVYLLLIAKHFPKYGISLIGHSLMDTHVHFAVIPQRESSLSDGIGQLNHDFACWQNYQCGKTGHLWQGRFYSCPVDENRVAQVLRYIELNPVRARMVEKGWEWEWSSARAHVSGQDPSGLLDMNYWNRSFGEMKWREFLEERAAEETIQAQIRRATLKGYFLGNKATALRLEREFGKQLLPGKPGRKRRSE
jgi:putative transposase